MGDFLKQLLIRTPLEGPARRLKHMMGFRQRRKNPDLREVSMEPIYMDEAVARIVKPASNCIDVGCHLGSMLSLLLKLAPKGKHTAFEPTPQKAAWLRKKFPEVDVQELAVSDKAGTVTFYCNENRSGFSGLRKRDHKGKEAVSEIVVRCDRLDAVITGPKIDFLKVDVEGGELDVLNGCTALLDRDHPAILFECSPTALSQFNATPKAIYELLTGHGYGIFLVKEFLAGGKPLALEAFESAQVYPFKAFNFLAIANSV